MKVKIYGHSKASAERLISRSNIDCMSVSRMSVSRSAGAMGRKFSVKNVCIVGAGPSGVAAAK